MPMVAARAFPGKRRPSTSKLPSGRTLVRHRSTHVDTLEQCVERRRGFRLSCRRLSSARLRSTATIRPFASSLPVGERSGLARVAAEDWSTAPTSTHPPRFHRPPAGKRHVQVAIRAFVAHTRKLLSCSEVFSAPRPRVRQSFPPVGGAGRAGSWGGGDGVVALGGVG